MARTRPLLLSLTLLLLHASAAAASSEAPSCGDGCRAGPVGGASVLQVRQGLRAAAGELAEEEEELEAEEELADESPAAEARPLQRSLLSVRAGASRSCQYCHCMVTSAAQCGSDTVADGAACGYEHVTSGAICGWRHVQSVALCGSAATKVCKYGRRRRWSGLKCSFKDVAQSCDVARSCDAPRTCEVARSCDMASSVSECIDEITAALPGDVSEYMQYVRNTQCSSISECKRLVNAGLSEAHSLASGAAQQQLATWISNVQAQVGPDGSAAAAWAGNVYGAAGPLIASVSDALANVSSSMVDFLGGHLPSFPKYDIGSVCTETGVGFWSVEGTDCGAFAAMRETFRDLANAQSRFNTAKSLFLTCCRKTGLFGIPTPFHELSIQSFCLPDWIVTGAEYFIGGIVHGAGVIRNLVEEITSVVQAFANTNIDLMQLGRAVLSHGRERLGTNSSSADAALSEASSECGVKPDWGVDITVRLALSVPGPSGESFSFSMGIGIGMGCEGGSLVTPNALLSLWVPEDHSEAAAPGASTVDIGVSFFTSFQSFSAARAQTGALVKVTGGVDFESVLGVPAGASLPELSFMALPAKSAPKGIYFSISRELGSGLEELGARVRRAVGGVHRSAGRGGVRGAEATAAMAAAAGQLAEGGLESALAGAEVDKGRLERQGAAAVERKAKLMEAGGEKVVSVSLSSELAFIFCITPTACS